jgi:hypothetical protein
MRSFEPSPRWREQRRIIELPARSAALPLWLTARSSRIKRRLAVVADGAGSGAGSLPRDRARFGCLRHARDNPGAHAARVGARAEASPPEVRTRRRVRAGGDAHRSGPHGGCETPELHVAAPGRTPCRMCCLCTATRRGHRVHDRGLAGRIDGVGGQPASAADSCSSSHWSTSLRRYTTRFPTRKLRGPVPQKRH